MMRYLQVLNLLYLLILYSCASDSDSRISQADFISQSDFVSVPTDLYELGTKLSYIPLDDSIPMKSIYIIKDIGNNIGIFADNGLFVFDVNGNLVNQLGRRGRGPAEYMVIDDFCTNDEGSKVFVLARNKIIVYTADGEFISEFKPFESMRFQRMEYHNNSLYFFNSFAYGVLENNWIRTDENGAFIESHKNYIPGFESTIKHTASLIFRSSSNLYYWNNLNDTIFEISKSGVNPYLLFAREDLRVNEEDMKTQESFYNMDKWLLLKVFPIDNRLLFLYHKMITQSQRFVLYNPATREAEIIHEVDVMEGNPGILNNIDGNISFTPYYQIIINEKQILAHWSDAVRLRRRVLSEDFSTAEAADTESKNDLIGLAESLTDDSNPVLILLTVN